MIGQILLGILALVLLFFFFVILYAMWLNIIDNTANIVRGIRRRK